MSDESQLADAPNPICPPPLDESFLNALFNGIIEAVYAVDLETRCIVYWNSGAERMFGYSADETLRRTTEFLLPDRASFDRIHEIAVPEIKQNGFWRGEWSYRRREGTIFPAEVTASLIRTPWPKSNDLNVVVVVRDITDRKELENQIHRLNQELSRRFNERTSELISTQNELAEAQAEHQLTAEHFRLLIEGVIEYAILMVDFGGHIISWNSGAAKIFGYRGNEVIGKHFSLLHVDEEVQAGQHPESLRKAIAEGSFDDQVQLLRKDGSKFEANMVVAPFYDAGGELTSFSVIVRDITERVALRQKLQEKEHLATIGTTASMFAHEVSNPLNGMSAAVQMFDRLVEKQDFPDQEPAKTILSDLKAEIRRLQSLLDDFRNLARPSALNLQPVDLVGFIRDLLKGLAANFAAEKITAREQFPATLPPVRGDPDKLKQALLNLLKNAAEAMPDGGTITITGFARGADVCLDVADTGTGIPEGLKIFEFFRTTKSGGTGLGLVIVRQIIDAHNGSITYTSQPGRGTTFHLTLPNLSSEKSE